MKEKKTLSVNIKSLILPSAIALVVSFIAINTQEKNTLSVATDCNYDTALPASHPNNLCEAQIDNISWVNWLAGNSRSSQFHFLDLLELLHGHEQSRPLKEANTGNL
ncbi:hypothetical protein LZP69_13760 [Shewanella sp. AS1]|uniref:hypothetical protein n=1 Tax=Shewanella sp. AS1 TaxID=2907626 RepID=UPI001F398B87|nr:hypothetical protein [Shewanella sp. AS1]MCE9680226.1 hypothetical protein [Shewanella sp. AS1]